MDPFATIPLPPTALNLDEVYGEDEMQGIVCTPNKGYLSIFSFPSYLGSIMPMLPNVRVSGYAVTTR